MEQPRTAPSSEGKTLVADFFEKINDKKTVTALVETLEGGGKKLVIQTEEKPPIAPVRAESPRRAHELHTVEALASYLKKYKTENTVVFADAAARMVYAVLDETEKKGVEQIRYVPKFHHKIKPWLDLMATRDSLTCGAFGAFIRLNRKSLNLSDAEQKALVANLAQIKATTTVEMSEGHGNNSVNGVLIKIKVQGKEQQVPFEFPETLTIRSPIFVGGGEALIEFDVVLILGSDGKTPVVRLCAPALEEQIESAMEDIIASLSENKDLADLVVVRGKPETAPWEYLRKQG